MRNPLWKTSSLLRLAVLLLAAGCGGRSVLIEVEWPWWRQYEREWEDLLVTDRGSVPLVVSNLPAQALAVNQWGTLLARAEHIEGQTWLKLYRTDRGNVSSAYRLSEDSPGKVTMGFLRADWLWVCDGRDVYSIHPGGQPRRIFPASSILVAPGGGRIAVVTGAGDLIEIRNSSASVVKRLEMSARPLAFSPDGMILLLVRDEGGDIVLVDLGNGARSTLRVPEDMPAKVLDAAFLPDGLSVAVVVDTGYSLALLHSTLPVREEGRLVPIARLGKQATSAGIIGTGTVQGKQRLFLLRQEDVSSDIVAIDPQTRETKVVYSVIARAGHGVMVE